jgi:DNA-binding GntR family transcriptional regulator
MATERPSEEGTALLRDLVEAEGRRVADGKVDQLHNFHAALAELSGNRVISLFIKMLTTLSEHQYFAHSEPPADLEKAEQVHDDHRAIVEAVVGYDHALARRRMHLHLERTLAETPPPSPSSSPPVRSGPTSGRGRPRRKV